MSWVNSPNDPPPRPPPSGSYPLGDRYALQAEDWEMAVLVVDGDVKMEDRSEYMCQATDSAKGDASDAQERATSSSLNADGWRPIETFDPELDARRVLISGGTYSCDSWTFCDDGVFDGVVIAALQAGEGWCRDGYASEYDAQFWHKPTHWMPLPPPSGRQDEVARSCASEVSHPDVKQLDTIKAELAEALEIISLLADGYVEPRSRALLKHKEETPNV